MHAYRRRHRRLRTIPPPALRLNVSELRSLIQRCLPLSSNQSQLRFCGIPQPAGCGGRLLRHVRSPVIYFKISNIDNVICFFLLRHGRQFEGSRLSIQVVILLTFRQVSLLTTFFVVGQKSAILGLALRTS